MTNSLNDWRLRISDSETSKLASIATEIQSDFLSHSSDDWEYSPFEWIRKAPSSRRKGAIGERLLSEYLQAKGFEVRRSPDLEADRVINGMRAEIKFSTPWQNGSYKFQQIRDQNYDLLICLGISPFAAHCWIMPKEEVLRRRISGDIASQHRGRRGQDTGWLSIDPDRSPDWLRMWGGCLSEATAILTNLERE